MRRTATVLLGLLVVGLAPAPVAGLAPGPTCVGRAATIVGTPGDDVLRGTPGPDVVAALGGNDVVRASGGDDVVCGGTGDDVLDGQRGDDSLQGGPGRDQIVSYLGADVLRGGAGTDRLEGLSAQPSRIRGGAGADFLFLAVTDAAGYLADGGPGQDIGDLSLGSTSAADGPAVVVRRGPGTLTRDGIRTGTWLRLEVTGLDERVGYEYYGTNAPDEVSVADGAFPFRAETYGGDDHVVSYAGDDVIDAGSGDDRVDAGPGTDTCISAERAKGCESLSP